MAVDFSDNMFEHLWAQFARPITVTPIVSQPGAPAYDSRGYFWTKETDVLTEAGSVYSDSTSMIDILLADFAVVPMQGDQISIPFHAHVPGGNYEVLDLGGVGDGAGTIAITLRQIVTPKPAVRVFSEP